MAGRIDYSELDEKTRQELQERFGIDGRPDEQVSKRTIVLGKVLSSITKLSNKDALWILNRAIEHIIPPAMMPSSEDEPREVTMEDIIRATAKFHNMEYEDLTGLSRKVNIASARHIAVYIMSMTDNYTLLAIGTTLGGRVAATVASSFAKIAKTIDHNRTNRNIVKEIRLMVGIKEL